MRREHGQTCRCAKCRHARFNPGPPSKPGGFYGHFRLGRARKQHRLNQAHAEALAENEKRGLLGRLLNAVGL